MLQKTVFLPLPVSTSKRVTVGEPCEDACQQQWQGQQVSNGAQGEKRTRQGLTCSAETLPPQSINANDASVSKKRGDSSLTSRAARGQLTAAQPRHNQRAWTVLSAGTRYPQMPMVALQRLHGVTAGSSASQKLSATSSFRRPALTSSSASVPTKVFTAREVLIRTAEEGPEVRVGDSSAAEGCARAEPTGAWAGAMDGAAPGNERGTPVCVGTEGAPETAEGGPGAEGGPSADADDCTRAEPANAAEGAAAAMVKRARLPRGVACASTTCIKNARFEVPDGERTSVF